MPYETIPWQSNNLERKGTIVPELQRALMRALTISEVQKQSTVKPIYHKGWLAAAYAPTEVIVNTCIGKSKSYMSKLHSPMRSQLTLGEADLVSVNMTQYR
jgi:hypothetical protein